MKNLILILLYFIVNPIFGVSKTQETKSSYNVKLVSKTKWDSVTGVLYTKVPGANLGATSFEVISNNQIAFLSNSNSEIVIINRNTGKSVKRVPLTCVPRDFVYDNGYFFILSENHITQINFNGVEVNKFLIPNYLVGIEKLVRYNNSTYLLLPNGNNLKIEEEGKTIQAIEKPGYITNTGYSVNTIIYKNNSYSVDITTNNGKSLGSKLFTMDKKIAGVYVIGVISNRIVLDVQTFISENPISVERFIVSVKLYNSSIGNVIAKIKVPDCYYVLSNKDFTLTRNGSLFNMITSPNGVYVFSLKESSGNNTGYPSYITKTKYHFNYNLIKVD
jgi:hypothetical protein